MRSLLFFLGLCLVGLGLGMPEVAPTKADGVKAAGPRLIQGLLTIIGGSYAGRIQPVIATHSLNRSAGVWKPSVLRGLSFNCLAIELSWCWE